ncbi:MULTISPECIES: hypothetical protein [Streptomyces]|uniref:Uncharacterized protein n=1 Tax=Streptomyces mirabilis TaxID=68239 RepID=A0ABU3UH18_9ACTN|nr:MULTISPECIES: hypothetical protein [Streptomyces]MCX4613080.1 hypothetical protein [Streptomyces mirabilis]MCX5353211.1 hypothetical protein [Streptomyces mirabilis]MDU8993214.1 hypothetical protein [Streptomyces mirabilis]QDN91229.1 hypothetical protein FNV61_41985 [Streptomyces sp. RLB3-6]QDO12054.1 hypothetical protein FNV68_43065 [Streptomyces sp. S1D4-23]
MLHLGATDWLPLAPASDGTHQGTFFVQPQSEDPEGADPAFTTAFNGSLLLPDGRIAVGDVEQLTQFVYQVGDHGEFKVHVAVDSPGADARVIDVTIIRSII